MGFLWTGLLLGGGGRGITTRFARWRLRGIRVALCSVSRVGFLQVPQHGADVQFGPAGLDKCLGGSGWMAGAAQATTRGTY